MTKEGEKKVFKLASARQKKPRDLACVRYSKGEYGRVLVKETKIRERWQSYFSRLPNGERESSQRLESEVHERHLNDRACSRISKEEVEGALRNMKFGKAVAPDHIPVEILEVLR